MVSGGTNNDNSFGRLAPPPPRRRPVRRGWPRPSRVLPIVVLVALVGTGVGLVWTQLTYKPEPGPLGGVYRDPNLTLTETSAAWIMTPRGARAGRALLLFPGGRVEPEAYLWTLAPLTAHGITVVVAKPRLHLAILDGRKLATFVEGVSGANRWYVGGHSLGGVKACQLTRDPRAVGLVLFAAYCTDPQPRLPVLVVEAEHDRVLNASRARQARANLPTGMVTEKVLAGANHASFGDYGRQSGDGTATRPRTEVAADLTATLVTFLR